LQLRRGP